MTIVVSSSKLEKVFDEKDVINIGTNPNCDFQLDLDFDVLLTLQYDRDENKCVLMNTFHNERVLFKGKPIKKVEIGNICKLMFADSEEFINIKILENTPVKKTVTTIAREDLTEEDMKKLYGNDPNAVTRVRLDKQKADIEASRVAIIKQVAFQINDLKNKIASNSRTNVFLHVAMAIASILCAFGLSNYLMGLSIKESSNYLHMPTNIKVWIAYSILVFGAALMLKQGVYLFLQSSDNKNMSGTARFAQGFMVVLSLLFMLGIYIVNLVYYMNLNDFVTFAVFISLFFSGLLTALSLGCGYFKNTSAEWAMTLNKYEYREDFESVLKAYRQWIERFVNSFSKTKIQNIKDRIFNLQIKSAGEVVVGILTAPFLAYGVSNTLAMCFPEAAGWVRISGLRISPVFLTLATFMIIFAFFSFVSAFTATKKIQGSQVIKQDGFSDYRQHAVNIFGLEGTRKLEADRTRSLFIGCSIIFIEFSMNISYFATEIGGDLQGLFLSFIAALVPTALLIAETFMLSQTMFDIYAGDELIAKLDRD